MANQQLTSQQRDDLKVICRALLNPLEVCKLMLWTAVSPKQYQHAQLGHAEPEAVSILHLHALFKNSAPAATETQFWLLVPLSSCAHPARKKTLWTVETDAACMHRI